MAVKTPPAGGIGFALMSVPGAQPESCIALLLDAIGLDRYLEHADLLITGEGRIDAQTGHGKAPNGVAQRARHSGVPVIALAGSVPPRHRRLSDNRQRADHALAGQPHPIARR